MTDNHNVFVLLLRYRARAYFVDACEQLLNNVVTLELQPMIKSTNDTHCWYMGDIYVAVSNRYHDVNAALDSGDSTLKILFPVTLPKLMIGYYDRVYNNNQLAEKAYGFANRLDIIHNIEYWKKDPTATLEHWRPRIVGLQLLDSMHSLFELRNPEALKSANDYITQAMRPGGVNLEDFAEFQTADVLHDTAVLKELNTILSTPLQEVDKPLLRSVYLQTAFRYLVLTNTEQDFSNVTTLPEDGDLYRSLYHLFHFTSELTIEFVPVGVYSSNGLPANSVYDYRSIVAPMSRFELDPDLSSADTWADEESELEKINVIDLGFNNNPGFLPEEEDFEPRISSEGERKQQEEKSMQENDDQEDSGSEEEEEEEEDEDIPSQANRFVGDEVEISDSLEQYEIDRDDESNSPETKLIREIQDGLAQAAQVYQSSHPGQQKTSGVLSMLSKTKQVQTIQAYFQLLKNYHLDHVSSRLAHSTEMHQEYPIVMPYSHEWRDSLKAAERALFSVIEFYDCQNLTRNTITLHYPYVGSMYDYDRAPNHATWFAIDHIQPERSTIPGSKLQNFIMGLYPQPEIPGDTHHRVVFDTDSTNVPVFNPQGSDRLSPKFCASHLADAVFITVCRHYGIGTPAHLQMKPVTYEVELLKSDKTVLVPEISKRSIQEWDQEFRNSSPEHAKVVQQYHRWLRSRQQHRRKTFQTALSIGSSSTIGDILSALEYYRSETSGEMANQQQIYKLLVEAMVKHYGDVPTITSSPGKHIYRQTRANATSTSTSSSSSTTQPRVGYIRSHCSAHQQKHHHGCAKTSDSPMIDDTAVTSFVKYVDPTMSKSFEAGMVEEQVALYAHYSLLFDVQLQPAFARFVQAKAQLLREADYAYQEALRNYEIVRNEINVSVSSVSELETIFNELPVVAHVGQFLLFDTKSLHKNFYEEFMGVFGGWIRIHGLRREKRVFNRVHATHSMFVAQSNQLNARQLQKLCKSTPLEEEPHVVCAKAVVLPKMEYLDTLCKFRLVKVDDYKRDVIYYTELFERLKTQLKELEERYKTSRGVTRYEQLITSVQALLDHWQQSLLAAEPIVSEYEYGHFQNIFAAIPEPSVDMTFISSKVESDEENEYAFEMLELEYSSSEDDAGDCNDDYS